MPYSISMLKFAIRLRELRLEKSMTQQQLADAFQVHQTTVKDWETKGKQPNYETLIKLAEFFEVTTDYLLGVVD